MARGDEQQDRLRVKVAWLITGVWAACFPLAVLLPSFPIILAQAPMMAVVGWLFASPLIRRGDD